MIVYIKQSDYLSAYIFLTTLQTEVGCFPVSSGAILMEFCHRWNIIAQYYKNKVLIKGC